MNKLNKSVYFEILISFLTLDMPRKLLNEATIFNILTRYLELSEYTLDEITRGAFVVIKHDQGLLYDKLIKSKLPCYQRHSSHPSLDKRDTYSVIVDGKCIGRTQMAIDSAFFRTLLFGKIKCPNNIKKDGDPFLFYKKTNKRLTVYAPPNDSKICTWFQFESSRWGSPNQTLYDTFFHSIEYINYIMNGKNQGPLGSSCYTGRPMSWNPLLICLKCPKNQTIQNTSP
jgi:hypothetical protein